MRMELRQETQQQPRVKRATMAALNAQMKAEGIDAELVKGNGYFYFSGPTYYPSIYVYALNQMGFDEWMQHIRSAVAEGN